MMDVGGFRDVIEATAFENDLSLQASRNQPRKVNRRVKTDGSERESLGTSWLELRRRDWLELALTYSPRSWKRQEELAYVGHKILIPWLRGRLCRQAVHGRSFGVRGEIYSSICSGLGAIITND